jgi:hypothetical protein
MLDLMQEVCPDLVDRVFRPDRFTDEEHGWNVTAELTGSDWRELWDIGWTPAEGHECNSNPYEWPRYIDDSPEYCHYAPMGKKEEPRAAGDTLPGNPKSPERIAYLAAIVDIAEELDVCLFSPELVSFYE